MDPLDPPVVDFICIQTVHIEGHGGSETGWDVIEVVLGDHTKTGSADEPSLTSFRFDPGLAQGLILGLMTWLDPNQQPPNNGHRHIHCEHRAHPMGSMFGTYWVPPEMEGMESGEIRGMEMFREEDDD